MAQPYDYILAKYIEIGKRESKYIGHSYYLSLSSALEMAKEVGTVTRLLHYLGLAESGRNRPRPER